MVLLENYIEFLTFALHDNNECYISRSGCRGREYYSYEDALIRINDFTKLEVACNIALYFCKGDETQDYYLPPKEKIEVVKSEIMDVWESTSICTVFLRGVPNVRERDGGLISTREFYHHRTIGMTQFTPASEYTIDVVSDYELKVGFPRIGKNALYQS